MRIKRLGLENLFDIKRNTVDQLITSHFDLSLNEHLLSRSISLRLVCSLESHGRSFKNMDFWAYHKKILLSCFSMFQYGTYLIRFPLWFWSARSFGIYSLADVMSGLFSLVISALLYIQLPRSWLKLYFVCCCYGLFVCYWGEGVIGKGQV